MRRSAQAYQTGRTAMIILRMPTFVALLMVLPTHAAHPCCPPSLDDGQRQNPRVSKPHKAGNDAMAMAREHKAAGLTTSAPTCVSPVRANGSGWENKSAFWLSCINIQGVK
jgi:hypothetical protein